MGGVAIIKMGRNGVEDITLTPLELLRRLWLLTMTILTMSYPRKRVSTIRLISKR